ncbi:hypothetical protein TNCT_284781 [Trichonephila clavata]|uniref:Uncharacterized protein n=1 Tax=Trichonephila clavata TaxID=2740835 RepID=A0A8X6J5W2_TRICU|nr:hypothetical protein TNCT_284781 [Trichonephila clavata]
MRDRDRVSRRGWAELEKSTSEYHPIRIPNRDLASSGLGDMREPKCCWISSPVLLVVGAVCLRRGEFRRMHSLVISLTGETVFGILCAFVDYLERKQIHAIFYNIVELFIYENNCYWISHVKASSQKHSIQLSPPYDIPPWRLENSRM